MDQPLQTFGSLLREHRLAAGHTHQDLADLANVSTREISNWENDYHRPQKQIAEQLANALKLAGEKRTTFMEAAKPRGRRRRVPSATGRTQNPAASQADVLGHPQKDMNAAGKEAGVKVFPSQEQAYSKIIEMVRSHRVAAATLIQHSCSSSFEVLKAIMHAIDKASLSERPQPVWLFIEHREVARAFGSGRQVHRIDEVVKSKIADLPKDRRELLRIRAYAVPGFISGVHIAFCDGTPALLMLGYVSYDKRHDQAGVDGGPLDVPEYHADFVDFSAHDRAAVLAHGGTEAYDALLPTFQTVVDNLNVTALSLTRPLLKSDILPAMASWFREGDLFAQQEQALDPIPTSALDLWDQAQYSKLAAVVEALLGYANLQQGEHWQEIARYQLLLGWIHKELGGDNKAAEDLLKNALSVYESHMHGVDVDRRHKIQVLIAHCHNHLGALKCIDRQYLEAEREYDKALDAIKAADRLGSIGDYTNLQAWIYLNRACLAIERKRESNAGKLLARSLALFQANQDVFGEAHCLAVFVRFALLTRRFRDSLFIAGALERPGKFMMNIMPTYHRPLEEATDTATKLLHSREKSEAARAEGRMTIPEKAVTHVEWVLKSVAESSSDMSSDSNHAVRLTHIEPTGELNAYQIFKRNIVGDNEQ